MTFEFGKRYIVDVTERGITPLMVFDRDRWYDKDHDDLDFLTNEEKIVVINDVLEKIRAEIKAKIEEEEFAHSVFRHEEKDTYKAEQCTGSIMAYNNVIKLIDKYNAESEDAE